MCVLLVHISHVPVCSHFHEINVSHACFERTKGLWCVCLCVLVCVWARVRQVKRMWSRQIRTLDHKHKRQVTHDSSITAIIMEQYVKVIMWCRVKQWTIMRGRAEPQVGWCESQTFSLGKRGHEANEHIFCESFTLASFSMLWVDPS